jgi:protein arginine kinase activator
MAKPEQCGNCKKPATIHLTQIVNNQVHKVDLCEDCPFKKGVTDPEGFSLGEFLLKPGVLTIGAGEAVTCPGCGFAPIDFKKHGRFGCPQCYETFKGMLKPMLANMHKDVIHRGKVPDRALTRVSIRRKLEELEEGLQAAIEEEAYEEAARLRDEIRILRGSLSDAPKA